MTIIQVKVNRRIDEVRFASVSDEDLPVFLARFNNLHLNIDMWIQKYEYIDVDNGVMYVGSCESGDRQVDLYEIRAKADDAGVELPPFVNRYGVPPLIKPSVSSGLPDRYAYGFAFNGVVYTLDYMQIGHYMASRKQMVMMEFEQGELWTEMMEWIGDYFDED